METRQIPLPDRAVEELRARAGAYVAAEAAYNAYLSGVMDGLGIPRDELLTVDSELRALVLKPLEEHGGDGPARISTPPQAEDSAPLPPFLEPAPLRVVGD